MKDKDHRKRLAEERFKLWTEKVVPPKFREADLENSSLGQDKIDFAVEWAKKPHSLFLCGDVGTGKTHYAFCLVRQFMKEALSGEEMRWPRYFTSPKLDKLLLDLIREDESGSDFMEGIASDDLLFIDDMGRETRSDRMRRQYFDLIDRRYISGLPTIITSNFPLNILKGYLDDSITDRIGEWMVMDFNGSSKREHKMHVFKRANGAS